MLVNSLNFENNQQHSVSLKLNNCGTKNSFVKSAKVNLRNWEKKEKKLNNCGTKNSFVKSAKVNLRNSPADKFIKHFKDFIRRF